MKNAGFIVLLIISILISGCTYQPDTISQPTAFPRATEAETPVITQTATPVITPSPVLVKIKGFAYDPATITLVKGTTVTWVQMDSGVQHTVTGTGFDSGILNAGDTFKWTFKKAGTFTYSCSTHSNMIGVVVVT
ncbi:MAG: plastocyanin/azurin family copper-binding protein [Candidatus Methanoperedens sp.]|nr:plastocyanin/azurin family copper-binding protein [Candidatus Methanoperedens sp.]